jgi:hypothetical protein
MKDKVGSRRYLIPAFLVLTLLSISSIAEADPTLSLHWYKNNGYGMGNDMNGEWTLNTNVSQDVIFVEFFLDGQLQQNSTAAPFNWHFYTDNYTIGVHTIEVVAHDNSGGTAVVENKPNFVGFPLAFVVGIISTIVVVSVIALMIAIYRVRKQQTNR